MSIACFYEITNGHEIINSTKIIVSLRYDSKLIKSLDMRNYDDKIVIEPAELDYVNSKAKVVIVGITPGNSQMSGSRDRLSLREIKRKYAFAGSMRPNLINMLDHIGINKLIGIKSCRSLWEQDFDEVDMTSLLKDAVYEIKSNGKKTMFNDLSKIAKSMKLQKLLENGFLKNSKIYEREVLYIGCGPGVYEVLKMLQKEGKIKGPIVGIAHPSGANAGRVKSYLGIKEPIDPSYQWCADKAEEAKRIINQLSI